MDAFADLVASYLNYLFGQAGLSLDAGQSEVMRDHAAGEVVGCLATPLDLAACERFVRLA